jgi:hypothetical protein
MIVIQLSYDHWTKSVFAVGGSGEFVAGYKRKKYYFVLLKILRRE